MLKIIEKWLKNTKIGEYYNKVQTIKATISELRESGLLNRDEARLFFQLLSRKLKSLVLLAEPNKSFESNNDWRSVKDIFERFSHGNVFDDKDAVQLKLIGRKKLEAILVFLGLEEKVSFDHGNSMTALRDFVQNFYHGDILSDQVAKINLKQGLIELVWSSGQHLGCGLLISDDGYFLTCYHCISNNLDRINAILFNNQRINKIQLCDYNVDYDIALAKIELAHSPRARLYKFFESDYDSLDKQPLFLVSVINGKQNIVCGLGQKIIKSTKVKDSGFYLHQLGCFLKSKKGDSGSVVTTVNGKIVGLLSTGNDDFYSGVTTWNYALELLSRFSYS